MSILVQLVWMLFLVSASCNLAGADEHPEILGAEARQMFTDETTKSEFDNNVDKRGLPQNISLFTPSGEERRDKKPAARSQEPFGLPAFDVAPSYLSAKWADLQSRMLIEEEILAACRLNDGNCSAVGRQLLDIIDMSRQRQGLARLGEINRAVNLSIKPLSDLKQYGVEDFWSAPLATLSIGAGDCEDYAILKYFALRAVGMGRDDLRLVIVRDIRRKLDHALLAARLDERWLLLDNRTLIMVDAMDARHYHPLFVLGGRGVREFAFAALIQ
jgi:predicted transglutaminase-like cysteine proteinase